jgi:hypothetical protein
LLGVAGGINVAYRQIKEVLEDMEKREEHSDDV